MNYRAVRGLSAFFVAGAIVCCNGCAPSNESQADIKGETPTTGVDGKSAPPKSQEEYVKQQQAGGGGSPYAGQNYPGQ